MVLGYGHGALGSRLGQGQAREAGTEKSDVSGTNLSRAVRSIAYALARASPTVRDGGVIQTAQDSTVSGEASLKIALANGLKPDGGAHADCLRIYGDLRRAIGSGILTGPTHTS